MSCPDLRTEIYTVARLDQQLDSQVQVFLANSTKGARIEAGELHLSKIFSWFEEDFADAGGGLYNLAAVTINNATFNLNTGGALNNTGASLQMSNTIVAGSIVAANCTGGGSATSSGYNLSSDNSCGFLTAGGDITNVDPMLDGLQDTGTGTAVHALRLNSPAIDAGNPAAPGSGGSACAATDQRGLDRPQSTRCDIGAYEAIVFRVFVPIVLGNGDNR